VTNEFIATKEQDAIIGADLGSQCVLACAGSGKTATAVRRLVEVRRRLGASRGYVALLSYSNVAVDTFRREYESLSRDSFLKHSERVLIATADSFTTTQIVAPHAGRLMKCVRQPFLVRGPEPFLGGHKIYNGQFPVGIDTLQVSLERSADCVYSVKGVGPSTPVSKGTAESAILKLAKIGAYTHELGRYWALRTLRECDRLAQIVARRFPHILVDEAQDVGSLHGAMLMLLQEQGATVTLIGDPNQAIFEFADADGNFLRSFAKDRNPQPLTANRRSVAAIVGVANELSGSSATTVRVNPDRVSGAYILLYSPKSLDSVRQSFATILKNAGYETSDAAILCRGRSMLEEITGGETTGKGATQKFIRAAICRDRQGDVIKAFEFVLDGTLKLLKQPPDTLRRDVLNSSPDPVARVVKRMLWRFLRNPMTGLPSATLAARSQWHPALKDRLSALLERLNKMVGLETSPSWKNNLTTGDLTDSPLGVVVLAEANEAVRVRTVHEVKGEGIAAVLYLAKKSDVSNLLGGSLTEEGRIGYVAVTRARDLLIIGVPEGSDAKSLARLSAIGFKTWES
jgi:superfamily I DNA/RNA helicase